VLAHRDHVLNALPFPPELRAGQQALGLAPPRSLRVQLVDQRVELATGAVGEAAEPRFLNTV
jgi:hypothetical protein